MKSYNNQFQYFARPLVWGISLVYILFTLTACYNSHDTYPVATEFIQTHVELGNNPDQLQGVLFIPLEGCGACVDIAIDFVKENIETKHIKFVLVSKTGKKQIHNKLGDAILDQPNIYVDEDFKSIKLGLVHSYPVLYYVKDKQVKEEYELSGLDIDLGLYDLQRRIADDGPTIAGDEVVINYSVIDQKPEFNGGINNFYTYIQNHFKYPQQAKEAGIEGRVLTEFVINKAGAIQDVKVVKGIGEVCDTVVRNVIRASPNWTPGKHKNEVVASRILIPVVLKSVGK